MKVHIRALAAVAIGTMLATSANAQNAKELPSTPRRKFDPP